MNNQSPVERPGFCSSFVIPGRRGAPNPETRDSGLRFRVRAFKSAVADLNDDIAELG
jgi:hypothetical protein